MYGKIYESTFTGSMVGTGAATFAVWGYVIANTKPDSMVELNPVLIAAMIGEDVSRIEEAIAKLCDVDERSRTKKYQGRRMIKRGEFLYYVPNHQKYRGIPNDTERKQYFARKQREHRQRVKQEPVKPLCQTKSKPVKQAEAEAVSISKEVGGSANGSRPTLEHDPRCNCGLCSARKKWKNEAKPQSVEDWLIKLEQNPTYKGINVRQLHGRMVIWCEVRGLKPTLRRLVTWLNKEDKPMPKHAARVDYKRNYPPAPIAPEVSDEERARLLKIAAEEKEKLRLALTLNK